MKKMILSLTVLGMLLFLGMTVYGKEKAFDADDFTMGFQWMDLLDEDAYQQNGKIMVQTFSDLIESLDDTDTFYLMEQKKEFLGDVYYKKTVNAEDVGYLYCGKLKDEKPNGWGILLDSRGNIFYMGNFKKGKIEGYGMVFMTIEDGLPAIVYEGNISKMGADRDVVPANGNAVIPYSYASIFNAYYDEINSFDEEISLEEDGAWVLRCTPNYIGKVKNGEYSGKGTLYDVYGNVIYEGQFKNGKYSGEGTLYYNDGSVQYKGKFKNGKFNGKGVLYGRDGSVQHKGEFKNGDVK